MITGSARGVGDSVAAAIARRQSADSIGLLLHGGSPPISFNNAPHESAARLEAQYMTEHRAPLSAALPVAARREAAAEQPCIFPMTNVANALTSEGLRRLAELQADSALHIEESHASGCPDNDRVMEIPSPPPQVELIDVHASEESRGIPHERPDLAPSKAPNVPEIRMRPRSSSPSGVRRTGLRGETRSPSLSAWRSCNQPLHNASSNPSRSPCRNIAGKSGREASTNSNSGAETSQSRRPLARSASAGRARSVSRNGTCGNVASSSAARPCSGSPSLNVRRRATSLERTPRSTYRASYRSPSAGKGNTTRVRNCAGHQAHTQRTCNQIGPSRSQGPPSVPAVIQHGTISENAKEVCFAIDGSNVRAGSPCEHVRPSTGRNRVMSLSRPTAGSHLNAVGVLRDVGCSRANSCRVSKSRENISSNRPSHGGQLPTPVVETKGPTADSVTCSRSRPIKVERLRSSVNTCTSKRSYFSPAGLPSSTPSLCRCGRTVAVYDGSTAWVCDGCERHSINQSGRHRCSGGCDYDLCARCVRKCHAPRWDYDSGKSFCKARRHDRQQVRRMDEMSRCASPGYQQVSEAQRLIILDGLLRHKEALESEQSAGYPYARRGQGHGTDSRDQLSRRQELLKLERTLHEFSKPRVLIKC